VFHRDRLPDCTHYLDPSYLTWRCAIGVDVLFKAVQVIFTWLWVIHPPLLSQPIVPPVLYDLLKHRIYSRSEISRDVRYGRLSEAISHDRRVLIFNMISELVIHATNLNEVVVWHTSEILPHRLVISHSHILLKLGVKEGLY